MIDEELCEVRRDLVQARDLLNDAVARLTGHFRRVADLVNSTGLDARAAEAVQSELGSAVVALQFEDIINQVLGHALKRLDAVELAQGGFASPAARAAGDGPGRPAGLTGPKPVAQRRMDPGDVELF